ncbi:MAG TPA: hypothetical protein VFZ61_27150, partial [Polyangiales bacterium]
MPQRSLLTHRTAELWLTAARAALALTVGLAIVTTENLYLDRLVGTLGMYAATDGAMAALSRRRTTPLAAWTEGIVGLLAGSAIMIWSNTERGLLVLFCARTVVVAGAELMVARQMGGAGWLAWRAPSAFLGYAALSALGLALAFLVAAIVGYGALDLYACIAGQLGIWAGLMAAHTA